MVDEQQEQQHETVTTTTTEMNLHKLPSITELIFQIDLRSDGPPTGTEPYYTRTVWPITECIGT